MRSVGSSARRWTPPAGCRARRGRLRAVPSLIDDSGSDRGGELPGDATNRQPRRRGHRAGVGGRHHSAANSSSAARSTSTWKPTPRSRWSTRTARSSSSPAPSHPSETQDIVAHVLGISRPTTSPCSVCGWAVDSAARSSSHTAWPRSLRWVRRSPGGRSSLRAEPDAGHHDDREAGTPFSGLAGRWASTPTIGSARCAATLTSNGGWSLDLSEPVLARALCYPHLDNAYWIPDIAVHGRVAKMNQTSSTRSFPASAARRV